MPIEFKPTEREKKTTRSYSLKPSTIALIDELAEAYGKNASVVIETLAASYIPKILAEKKRTADKL